MNDDIFESVPQRGSGEETAEIAESMKSPMNSFDAANYMKRNFEMAKGM